MAIHEDLQANANPGMKLLNCTYSVAVGVAILVGVANVDDLQSGFE